MVAGEGLCVVAKRIALQYQMSVEAFGVQVAVFSGKERAAILLLNLEVATTMKEVNHILISICVACVRIALIRYESSQIGVVVLLFRNHQCAGFRP